MTEGGIAIFAVTLGSGAMETVTVDYVTQGGTAMEGSDYERGFGTLTFAAGEQVQTQEIEVRTLQDDLQEMTEMFTVRLTAVTGARLADASGIGSIVDDGDSGDGGEGGREEAVVVEEAEVVEEAVVEEETVVEVEEGACP